MPNKASVPDQGIFGRSDGFLPPLLLCLGERRENFHGTGIRCDYPREVL